MSGEPIHIHYRRGVLSVNIGPVGGSVDDALSMQDWFSQKIGGNLDGEITLEEVYRVTGLSGPKL